MRPLLLVLLLASAAQASDQLVYVSCSDDRRVRVFAVAADGALIDRKQPLELPGKPGPMALAPDGQRIYLASTRRAKRQRIHEVLTLRRGADGGLRVEATQAVDTRKTFLRVGPAGRFLLTASYGAGHASVHRIQDGACVERVSRAATERTAHCVELDRSGRFAFVPHTVPNKIYQLRFDPSSGSLEPNDPPSVAGPPTGQGVHGPRHVRFHPTLPLAYSSNELSGGISAWRFDPERGSLTLVQTLGTLPKGFKGKSTGAEVRITPDGRFAYVSNRDHGDDRRDTLAGFGIDRSGALTALGHTPTPSFPRAFTIDRGGRFVYVAGQKDGGLAAYRIETDGALTEVTRFVVGQRPSWVLCVD